MSEWTLLMTCEHCREPVVWAAGRALSEAERTAYVARLQRGKVAVICPGCCQFAHSDAALWTWIEETPPDPAAPDVYQTVP